MIAAAQLSGYLSREYVHEGSGEVMSILLVCGRPGPVAVHTPDICYRGGGYEMSPKTPFTLPAEPPLQKPAHFLTAKFVKEDATAPDALRIYWAWNAGDGWVAPTNPRWAFARYRALYKLYVIHHLTGPGESPDGDPSQEFMKVLLPQLHQSLFPGS
jgi:hypothetical protein